MYYPYLRGRQYELLALKELATRGLLSNNIIPVVEPIKLTSTFDGCMKAFIDNKLPIAIIFNPIVGELTDVPSVFDQLHSRFLSSNDMIVPTVLLNQNAENVMELMTSNGTDDGVVAAVLLGRDSLDIYRTLYSRYAPRFTLCSDDRLIRRTVTRGKILFEDKFKKRDRNADYSDTDDEFYSDDHLYFKDDGFSGFGDFTIVGDDYIEAGFAPYAVAIHIVYFDAEKILRIRHFVSDSNDDISDVAGKYYEAVSKLAKWYNAGQSQQLTTALSTFLDHANTGYYPGLPTVKKLSIMHHFELMEKYLDGGL
jgi:hypothetical protein